MTLGTDGQDEAPADTIADEAARWNARLRAPDCGRADRIRFTVWRDANPAHRDAFEKLEMIVATLHHDRRRAAVRALRDEALCVVAVRRRRGWMTMAAGLLCFVVGIAAWRILPGDGVLTSLSDMIARLSGVEIYATDTGERSTFVLEDGSSVELNARSRINVDFSNSLRHVELVRGQALFTVTKNNGRPFVVRAGKRDIVAVGTQFDVRLDENSMRITLIEGKVRVVEQRPDEEILLTPGEQLIARFAVPVSARTAGAPKSDDVVRNIDVTKVTGWRDGRIFLEDIPLQDAVQEMNRYGAVQIRLEDSTLAQRRITGMFKAGEQEVFIAALEDYFPIAVHRNGRTVVLTPR